MAGFKNCPSVTMIALGMDIEWHSGEYRIVAIDDAGRGLGFRYETGGTQWFTDLVLHECVLDLDSVWVGRGYRLKDNHRQKRVVLMATTEDVCFRVCGRGLDGLKLVRSRDSFLDHNEPIPFEPADLEIYAKETKP